MFETLEETTDPNKAQTALRKLVFKQQKHPEAIALSLQRSSTHFEPWDLLDEAAMNELPILYTNHRCTIPFPSILTKWDGDFREGTEEIYDIVNTEESTHTDDVKKYQKQMRDKLPQKIPLVRGIDSKNPTKHSLTSWTAKVGVARLYGDYILYTTVSPEDVFMCSLHGEKIGEQEFVLTDYEIEEIYDSTLESQIELYQRMQKELER